MASTPGSRFNTSYLYARHLSYADIMPFFRQKTSLPPEIALPYLQYAQAGGISFLKNLPFFIFSPKYLSVIADSHGIRILSLKSRSSQNLFRKQYNIFRRFFQVAYKKCLVLLFTKKGGFCIGGIKDQNRTHEQQCRNGERTSVKPRTRQNRFKKCDQYGGKCSVNGA